ncbi:hypothetical protein AWE51_09520 [Aquimarina aggregata]|uniref:Uncharacterized protein n=1 Tax=Aquimarina aggregata TaxID=1642818 RepID=A0A162CNN8_9FLAO|nr:hypothetical protein [Aquimarina aggregata]KZS39874.1 hypothetical protein AWE51_09520 [Aquimarina aggregata]
MKLIITLFSILLLGIFKGFSQTKGSIKTIKEKYTIITDLLEKKELTQTILQSNCEDNNSKNIQIGFYYADDVLVYINHTYNQGHNNYNYHYYIWDNVLIFYFSDHASWNWDYECAPKEQEYANEVWTYEEKRVYLVDETPIKCLYKTFEEKSIDRATNPEIELSSTIKNKNIDCNKTMIENILSSYKKLLALQDKEDICNLDID